MRLSMPIFTMWNANDCIATPRVLKTWKDVAKGRIEHMIISRSGHRIAQECLGEVANKVHLHSLPSLVVVPHTFRSFRGAYRLLRTQDQVGASTKLKQGTMFRYSVAMSPFLGTSNVPYDFELEDLNLDALQDSAVITPQTKQVVVMRQGNAEWRVGNRGQFGVLRSDKVRVASSNNNDEQYIWELMAMRFSNTCERCSRGGVGHFEHSPHFSSSVVALSHLTTDHDPALALGSSLLR